MKRFAFSLLLCLCAFVGTTAQTIRQNDKFWDGEMLYVAHRLESGVVLLKGTDISGNTRVLELKKQPRPGEYTLSRGEGDAPYNCLWGCYVKYIKKNGMHFLGFYVEEHTIGQTMVLTPDNVVDCTAQQQRAEEKDPLSMVSIWLMNQRYLSRLQPEVLQAMIDKLQQSRRKTIIESTNQQLIAYALAVGL